MADELAINKQVVYKEKLRNCVRIRIGTILAFKDDNKIATVALQDDPRQPKGAAGRTRRDIPVSELSPVSKVYGRARVQVNPTYRTIRSL